ncbi:trypsin-1 isoform X2 [Halictus rubicundus]|uniref:trypsin-1 isoform X2 n=1 Tax=Halictus rubicundus TaxID=77578 RepID=UPI004035F531
MSKKVLFLICILLEDVLASSNTRHVNIQDYPYHVSIERNRIHVCSGALVHESWVITAASCVFGADPSTVFVRARTGRLASGGDELEASGIVVHEDFDKYVLLNDIALIKDGPGESQLTATAVPIVNQDTCISMIPSYEPVFEKMLCAGNMTLGVETCQGDPGAPLMEGQTLIGVLSYGLGCKTMIHPGVYTRVSSYAPWISANSGIRYT